MPYRRYLIYFFLAAGAAANAQAGSLTTLFAYNDGQDGNMFDVQVTSTTPLLVTQLALNLGSGFDGTIEIYKKSGSYVGFETNSSAWTLVDTVNNVVSAGSDTPTLIDPVDFLLPGNATTAFYITDTSGFRFLYTVGTGAGNVAASNADLEILEGAGVAYPFESTFTPRIWDGTIFYQADSSAAPEPSTAAFLAVGALGLFWKRRRAC